MWVDTFRWTSRTAVALVLMLPGLANAAAPLLVQTTSFSLADDVTVPLDPARRKFRFKASTKRDPLPNRIVLPAPGSDADPMRTGAVLVIQNLAGTGERVELELPAAGWSVLGSADSPTGYTYRATDQAAPVARATLKADLLYVNGGGAGFGYTLDEPQQGRVGVRLDVGSASWCAETPAKASGNPPSTARSDLPGRFRAPRAAAPPSACNAVGTRFELTVQNGYGSGTYRSGTTVHVWAAADAANQVVTGWGGDASLLAEPEEWHTTLVMPARDATVSATVADRPVPLAVSQYTGVTARPKTVRSFIPPGARGLVLMLHGTGGGAGFIVRPEAFAVALRAIESGYGVLGTEAEEAVAGDLDGDGKERWDAALTATNVDFGNLQALIAGLRQAGTIAADTPLFALGMSNGGAMSVSLGAVASTSLASLFPDLRFGAVVSHCAGARAGAVALTTTPSAFYACGNDDHPEVDNVQTAADSAAIAARGVASVYDAHPASPLYDQRFERIGLAPAVSQAVAAELRAAGFVDAAGLFAVPTDDIVAAISAGPLGFPAIIGLAPAQRSDVVSQVAAMRAEHEMYSDWARRAVAWFEARTP